MQKIKKWLHPGVHNDYHPHLLRAPAIAVIFAIVLVMQLGNAAMTGRSEVLGFSSTIKAQELAILVNNERQAYGRTPLVVNEQLGRSAELKARDMLKRDYWSHETPEGEQPWIFFKAAEYDFQHAGENLAYGFFTSSGVVAGWMASEGHKENILSVDYREVGFAVVHGEYQGNDTSLIVAHFGAPVSAVTGAAPAMDEDSLAFNLPAKKTYSIIQPLRPSVTLPFMSQLLIIIISTLGLLYVVQHLTLVRHRLTWDRVIHQHPLLRSAVFLSASALMIVTSFGAVG